MVRKNQKLFNNITCINITVNKHNRGKGRAGKRTNTKQMWAIKVDVNVCPTTFI